MGGLVLLGIGALLVASVAAGDEKKPGKLDPDPEPKPVPPGPQPVATACTPTSPGDGPGNGKEAAVRAWQGCLVAAGCLAPDQIDGKHGPMTTGASELYISSGGKCAAPFKLPTGGGAPADRVYALTLGGQLKRAKSGPGTPKAIKEIVAELKAGAQDIADKAIPAGSENGLYAISSALFSDQVSDPRTHETIQIKGKSSAGGTSV